MHFLGNTTAGTVGERARLDHIELRLENLYSSIREPPELLSGSLLLAAGSPANDEMAKKFNKSRKKRISNSEIIGTEARAPLDLVELLVESEHNSSACAESKVIRGTPAQSGWKRVNGFH